VTKAATTKPVDGQPNNPGYAEAMAELESILVELEDGEVDIDRLGDQVKRAGELVRTCQGRLDEAKTEVTRIVAELDQGSGTESE